MEWLMVDVYDTIFNAANFLDGVLVEEYPADGPAKRVYVPGWKVIPPTGDMDSNAFRRRETSQPTYQITFQPVK